MSKLTPAVTGEDEKVAEIGLAILKVIELVARSRNLYGLHRNVEEGNYLQCLVCGSETSSPRRDLSPLDVEHKDGCEVMLANELLPTVRQWAAEKE